VERERAKRIVYAVIYGIGRDKLGLALSRSALICHITPGEHLKVSSIEADAFMKSFLAKSLRSLSSPFTHLPRYPSVARFQAFCIERCAQQGFVETILNRRRAYPKITSSVVRVLFGLLNESFRQFAERSYAERSAINFVIQGSAADIMFAIASLVICLLSLSQGSWL
jgi:DNA polymerase nu